MTVQQQSARLRPFRPMPFGRYTLLSPLATGGMGEIFLARLDGLQGVEKLCVIKKILPHLSSDKDFVERFVNEAKILVKLSHGSIAQVLDVGLNDGDPYIALEYVDGKDLRKVSARARDNGVPLPLTFVLFVMSRVLDALAYAHRKKDDDDKELSLVHRDVSPQNILISYEGEVKVIDFGLAKSTLNVAKTHPSIILGKFLYMSPEQARHQPVDRRSDLYAVGLCLFELITGKNPFDDVPPGELMAQVASPVIPSLGEVEPLSPGSVQALVSKALQIDPAQRFQSAEEFRGKLLGCLLEIDAAAGPESVSRYMMESFATEHGAERKLLSSLREANRVGGRAGPPPPKKDPLREQPTAVVNLPVPGAKAQTQTAPLSFAPTPRSKDDTGERRSEGETSPGLAVEQETRPAISLSDFDGGKRAKGPLVAEATTDGGGGLLHETKPAIAVPPAPGGVDTQPRVVLGALLEGQPTHVETRPKVEITATATVGPQRVTGVLRRRWLWPVVVLGTLLVLGTAGYFSMKDVVSEWIHGEAPENQQAKVEIFAPGTGPTNLPLPPPAPAPAPPAGAVQPLPSPQGAPPATTPAGAGDSEFIIDLGPPDAKHAPDPRKPAPHKPAHVYRDSFHKQWEVVSANYRSLLKRHPCEDTAVSGEICVRYHDLEGKIDTQGGNAGSDRALWQSMDGLNRMIIAKLRAP